MKKTLICVLPLLVLLSACASVPYTGRKHMLLISLKEEMKMGREAYANFLKGAKLSTDIVKVEMVRRVGRSLAEAANDPRFEWEFNLIENNKVNAFCLPGGKVAIYTGLLPVTKDEAGLAVVIGHEIAHVIARHGAERMSQRMAAGIGGKLLGAILSSKAPAVQDAFGKVYGVGVGVVMILPFSRKHEFEADRIGLILMAKGGYDPNAALTFWKSMGALNSEKNSPVAGYLSTHPLHDKRIEGIRDRIPEAMQHYKK